MSKFTVAAKRFGGFLKRNAFYFLIILCIASVATVIALAVTRNNNQTPDTGLNNVDDNPVINPDNPKPDDKEPDNPVKKLTFINPCNGKVTKEFADTSVMYNPTMKQDEAHTGLDYVSDDLNVYATADGVIKETGYDALEGYYIIVSHEEGYESYYSSLENQTTLKVGTAVKQGQLLGKMSDSRGYESLDGAHLHFVLYKDGVEINPLSVIVLDEK